MHARAVIMREARQPRGRGRAPRPAGSTGCADAASPAVGGIDTRALVRHIRDRGAMRGGVFPARADRARGARRVIAAEPPMSGRDLAREVTPARADLEAGAGDGPRVVAHRHRHQELDRAQPARARRAARAAARAPPPPTSVLAREPDAVFLANGPGDPAALELRGGDGARPGRQGAGVRHLPRPPAALPRGRPRDVQAALRPPRRQPPGEGPRDGPDRDHRAEPRLRGPRARTASSSSTDDRPVRWETDFGAAELSHLNLYDRTVEGLMLRDVPGVDACSTTPRRARARTTRCTCSTGSWSWSMRRQAAADAAPRRHPQDPGHRLRARSSSARRPSSTTPARRPARCCSRRATRSCSSTPTRRRS